MHLGNDIVHLDSIHCHQRHDRPGFINKVLTETEKVYFQLSTDKKTMLWLFWSIKEAAYKCCSRKDPTFLFSPKKFNTRSIKRSENGFYGEVVFDSSIYSYRSSTNGQYLHTIVFESNLDWEKVFIGIKYTHSASATESDSIRKFAASTLSGHFNAPLKFGKTSTGFPFFYDKNKTIPISFSHHDGWLAFCTLAR